MKKISENQIKSIKFPNLFVPVREDSFDGRIWADMSCSSVDFDTCIAKMNHLASAIPEWNKANPFIGFIECQITAINNKEKKQ